MARACDDGAGAIYKYDEYGSDWSNHGHTATITTRRQGRTILVACQCGLCANPKQDDDNSIHFRAGSWLGLARLEHSRAIWNDQALHDSLARLVITRCNIHVHGSGDNFESTMRERKNDNNKQPLPVVLDDGNGPTARMNQAPVDVSVLDIVVSVGSMTRIMPAPWPWS